MPHRIIKTLLQPLNLDFSELEDISSIAQSSRVVGIGEGAHFVSEFSSARASLIRYFVEAHGFNAIGLECGAIQGARISKWLNSPADTERLEKITNPLTFALYGSVLIWLKSYLIEKEKKIDLIGVDLPNTLSPLDDLGELSRIIELLDPVMTPEIDALSWLVKSISGESAVVSSMKWSDLSPASQDKAFSHIMRVRLRLSGLAPVLVKRGGHALLQEALERALSIAHTLETLRIMSSLFEGTSLEGDTSVREAFMATIVEKRISEDSGLKMLLLAHNNHIQKTSVFFSGELTAVPVGQHLAHRQDYRAIGVTHLGNTVPEMQYPSPDSPLGFSVELVDADKIREDSLEHKILDLCGVSASCLVVSDDMKGTSRLRSQSTSVETNVSDAFDAIFCVPGAEKGKLVNL